MKKQNLKNIIWWLVTDEWFLKEARRSVGVRGDSGFMYGDIKPEVDLVVETINQLYKHGAPE